MSVFPQIDALSLGVYAALAGVIVLAARLRPSNAIVAVIATAPFDFSHTVGATTITFDKVAILAAIVGLCLRRPGVAIPRALALSIVAVVVATFVTIVVAEYRGPVIRETFKWIEYLLVFALAATAWRLDPDEDRLRLATILTVVAVAVLALVQLQIGSPSVIAIAGSVFPRIAGPIEGPNQLAAYLGIALPFFTIWAIERVSWMTLLAIAVTTATLVLTLSRAGVLFAAVEVAVVFALSPRGARATIAIAYASGIAGAAGFLLSWNPEILARFLWFGETGDAGGVGKRSILWRAAYTLWEQHPVLGVGAGNFELLLPRIGDVGIRTHANSWYLQSLAEGGLPLLLATCALVWTSIGTFIRALRKPLCLAAFAASIAFALHGFVDYLVFYPKVAIMWFALLGVAAEEAVPRLRSG